MEHNSIHPLDRAARAFAHLGVTTDYSKFQKYIELTGDENTTLSLSSVEEWLTEIGNQEIEIAFQINLANQARAVKI